MPGDCDCDGAYRHRKVKRVIGVVRNAYVHGRGHNYGHGGHSCGHGGHSYGHGGHNYKGWYDHDDDDCYDNDYHVHGGGRFGYLDDDHDDCHCNGNGNYLYRDKGARLILSGNGGRRWYKDGDHSGFRRNRNFRVRGRGRPKCGCDNLWDSWHFGDDVPCGVRDCCGASWLSGWCHNNGGPDYAEIDGNFVGPHGWYSRDLNFNGGSYPNYVDPALYYNNPVNGGVYPAPVYPANGVYPPNGDVSYPVNGAAVVYPNAAAAVAYNPATGNYVKGAKVNGVTGYRVKDGNWVAGKAY